MKHPNRDKIHLIVNLHNTAHHMELLKTNLEKQAINPTPTRERNIKRLVDSLVDLTSNMEKEAVKLIGISYAQVQSVVKKTKK